MTEKNTGATQLLDQFHRSLSIKSKDFYRQMAKSFFTRAYKTGDPFLASIDRYIENTSNKKTQIILRSFKDFVLSKVEETSTLDNDVVEKESTSAMNEVIEYFLIFYADHLPGHHSSELYKKILLLFGNHHLFQFQTVTKTSAVNFIEKHEKTDRTKKLYKAVLKAFFTYIIEFKNAELFKLNEKQKRIQELCGLISIKTCTDIINIKQRPVDPLKSEKDTLSHDQRILLLKHAGIGDKGVIVALMAWNGLRLSEALKISVSDVDFKDRKIFVTDKGSTSGKSKSQVYLMPVTHELLKKHLDSLPHLKKDKRIFSISEQEFTKFINSKLDEMQIRKKRDGRYRHTCESLRLTAGQLLYDNKTPLEYIQRTLRYKNVKEVFRFAERAKRDDYFREMEQYCTES